MNPNRGAVIACLVVSYFLSACSTARVNEAVERPRTESLMRLASISPSIPSSPFDEDNSDYTLGAEDVVEVSVWKSPELSTTVFIRPDGKISLPLIGDVHATGLTPIELRDSIKVYLRRYKKTPEVSVIVRGIDSFSIFFVGEVANPGKVNLKSETTFLQALTLVGGLTEFASAKKIVLLRRENGKERRIRINYKDILSGENPNGNVVLKRGDTILVP